MDKLLKSPTGKVLISIIWALGIAALFMKVCKGSCLVVREPEEFDSQIRTFECQRKPPGSCGPEISFLSPRAQHLKRHRGMEPQHQFDGKPKSCYRHNPMDTIYQAPNTSNQYTYTYN